MRLTCAYLVLLAAGGYSADLREALPTATPDQDGQDRFLTPQNNYNGWVNPEDLMPMPQCIAQQDQSTWLETMTKCTAKQCTSHFGIICTHHQWLTQLSCLSVAFSSDVTARYLPYCGRSILAKAQLYSWIRDITGREWLVEVGDANELQNLSPASLAEGFTAVDVINTAPKCLTGSVCSLSTEPFQHVIASCGFTSSSQHTGNAARPWEYNEPAHSMIALDSETVGYDLIGHYVNDNRYFDKACFCSAFAVDFEKEPCSGSGRLDFTKERLWLNATCGSTSLPDNWADTLITTQFAFIAIEDWRWPKCVADMPKQVTGLTDQCATDACELDSSGYCQVTRAVDRECFCHKISYDSCEGSCQIFETRIDYIKWLHDLCGNVQDWHGLPDNWRQLSAPTLIDMIPWQWALKPSNAPDIPITPHGDAKATVACPSNQWKLGSFAIVNIATFCALLLCQKKHMLRSRNIHSEHSQPLDWAFKGIILATVQIFASWLNFVLVQHTPGYEEVPIFQLILLWCSMPRLSWLAMLLLGLQHFGPKSLSVAASLLFAEILLQILSAYYLLITINSGRQHNFYFNITEIWLPARIMYAGALMWLIIVLIAYYTLWIQARRRMQKSLGSVSTPFNITEEGMPPIIEYFNIPTEKRSHLATGRPRSPEEAPLMRDQSNRTIYDPLLVKAHHTPLPQRPGFAKLYAATTIFLLLLWVAQLLFWGGFIGLSSDEFCPPKLGALAAVWTSSSLLGTILAFH
ncbi:hypothetical protein CBS147482_4592 [Aspergillus niger]|nr:hypothetical protein CBS147482_4592 [Aspergillus niger]KAI3055808.1 hypothetical protein CBS147352_2848 [Aspergillus niger]